MFLPLLFLLSLTPVAQPPDPSADTRTTAPEKVIDGRGTPTVTFPRLEETAQIDGRLDGTVWSRATRLGH